MTSCGAILLAGGQSRRMGRDKALLPFGSEALAERLYHRLEACCSQVVVVRDPARGFPVPGALLVPDRYLDRGPLEGIASGLEALETERAVVVACDMPFVSPAVLTRLMAYDPQAPVVMPRTERGLEPLLAVYARRTLSGLRAFLDAGERRPQRLAEVLVVREIGGSALRDLDPTGRCFWNLNHPPAYEEALRLMAELDG